MSNPIPPTSNDDFDPKELVRAVDTHANTIATLDARIQSLEDRLGSNEILAETLSETAETAVKMQTMMASTFVNMLNSRVDVKSTIHEIIHKCDRNAAYSTMKKFGGAAYKVAIWVFGIIIGAVITRYFS